MNLHAEQEKETDSSVKAIVEDYLDKVCHPLIETHAYHVRQELRQELAQHLYSLVRAYEEMGDPPALAVEKALAKFGKAESVARRWKLLPTARRRAPIRRWFQQQWQGVAATLAMCSIAMAVCGGVTIRTLGSQQAAAKEQARAAQSQSAALVPNAGLHHNWAAQHRCTECHRSEIRSQAGSMPGFQNSYWALSQSRQ